MAAARGHKLDVGAPLGFVLLGLPGQASFLLALQCSAQLFPASPKRRLPFLLLEMADSDKC